MVDFKAGDKVKVIDCTTYGHCLEIGSVATVKSVSKGGDLYLAGKDKCTSKDTTQTLHPRDVELVKDMYEDGWILNDGKVTIPDDAQKSIHEGSVVAFRKKKEKPLEFGDEVIEGHLIYKFIRYTNSIKTKGDLYSVLGGNLLQDVYLKSLERKSK